MRSILIVVGIAVGAVIFSIILQPKGKDLVENPVEKADQKQLADATKTTNTPQQPEPLNPPREGVINATLTLKGKGDLAIEFYPKAAPKTVQHITDLIRKGFYDGIKFHRVVPSFVMQAGDPETKTQSAEAPGMGTHGSGTMIPFEKNDLKNVMFSMAMARAQPLDSADSQFFISLSNNKSLDSPDNPYCVFGQVVGGREIVPKIERGDIIEKFSIK